MNIKGMIIGAVAGAAIGWFIRCTDGTCPITSNWWLTMLIGAVFGLSWSNPPVKKEAENKESADGAQ